MLNGCVKRGDFPWPNVTYQVAATDSRLVTMMEDNRDIGPDVSLFLVVGAVHAVSAS